MTVSHFYCTIIIVHYQGSNYANTTDVDTTSSRSSNSIICILGFDLSQAPPPNSQLLALPMGLLLMDLDLDLSKILNSYVVPH